MRERPILMATESVKAILEGRKSQTRRIIVPQPDLLYGVYGATIQVIHNDMDKEDNNGRLDIEANTDIAKRQLYGGKRWEDIFKNKVQRLRQEGFSGLVSISRARHGAERIFSGFVVPQQYQGDMPSSPLSMYGISRDAPNQVNAGQTPRWQPPQQQTRESEVGNSIRELAGSQVPQSTQPSLQQSKFEDILKGPRPYPLGNSQGDSKPKAYSKSIRDEPTIHIRNMPWSLGRRLWVRETWAILDDTMILDKEVRIQYKADDKIIKRRYGDICYNEYGIRLPVIDSAMLTGRWKPAHHLPHIISRITLEITEVRVERLQEITSWDSIAEGIAKDYLNPAFEMPTNKPNSLLTQEYQTLWDSLNAKRGYSFESNPWVWVLAFRRLECQT